MRPHIVLILPIFHVQRNSKRLINTLRREKPLVY